MNSKQIKLLEKQAFAKYNASRYSEAKSLLKQILEQEPKHSLAQFYMRKIEEQKKSGKFISEEKTPISPTQRISRNEALSKVPGNVLTQKRLAENIQYVASTKRMTKEEVWKKSIMTQRFQGRTEKTAKKHTPPGATAVLRSKKTVGPIKVMVVDDSSLMRKVIIRILEKSPAIKVVGEATNGQQALEQIPLCKPEVVTLDVNMPIMDGVTALKHILVSHNLPVIMLSAYTEEGAITTFDCLTYGAIDFICKPSREGGSLSGKESEIVQKVSKACQVQVKTLRKARFGKRETKNPLNIRENASRIIVIGAGEGGYGGFLKILPHLPEHLPCAILAVQYMEDRYFEAFYNYLNNHSRILVKKAEDQEPIRKGVCYLANQKVYLKIQGSTEGYKCQVAKKPDFLMQQNVFNHLLFSAAETYGANCIGIVLAGKGIDGIEGIRELKRVRAITLAQDPKTCLISQLCEIAINSGSIDRVVADADFPGVIWHLAKTASRK